MTPPAHGITATVSFVGLASWPAAATLFRPGPDRRDRPWVSRPPGALTASAVMLLLGGWLALELSGGAWARLAERLTAGTEALWPLVVVLTGRRWARQQHGPARRAG